MKVKELIKELEDLDPEAEVIMQKDAEGNGYSPCAGADGNVVYVPTNSWSGEVYDCALGADDHCLEEDEWQKLLAGPRCVVLWPIN